MRKLPDIFFCLLIGISFLTAKTGLTVHHCLREDSYRVVLMAADPSCRAIHAQDDFADPGSCSQMHNQKCCSTQVFSLEDPTLISHGTDAPELIRELVDQEFSPAPSFGLGIETAGITAVRLLHPLPLESFIYPGNHLVPLRL